MTPRIAAHAMSPLALHPAHSHPSPSGRERSIAGAKSRTPHRARMASSALRALWNSPTGPKTTHFWGPVANWGFVLAGLADTQKPEERVSGPMTGALVVYSGLFMRFAWRVQPRNYILLACHTANANVQAYNLQRWARWAYATPDARA